MSQITTEHSVGPVGEEMSDGVELHREGLFEMGTLEDTKGGLQGTAWDGGFGVKPI